MANYIKVSTDRLHQDRDRISDEVNGLGKAVEQLADVMQSLGQTWEGPAWQTFQGQVASDIENMTEICKNLGTYLQHIEYAGKEYAQCETIVERAIRSLRI